MTISENPLFNITILIGIIFFLTGLLMFQFPPKKINSFYGYKTPLSMKNQENWDFAQRFASKEMMKLGLVLAAFCGLAFVTDFSNSTNLILGLFLAVIVIFILFLRVEKAIRKNPGN